MPNNLNGINSEYQNILTDLKSELGGFGEKTIQGIEATFDSADELRDAARKAYENRDTSELEQVDQLGSGYALKLARWFADREGWSGGDAEPQEVEVMSGDEFVEKLEKELDPDSDGGLGL